jgi:hypothetical protein
MPVRIHRTKSNIFSSVIDIITGSDALSAMKRLAHATPAHGQDGTAKDTMKLDL